MLELEDLLYSGPDGDQSQLSSTHCRTAAKLYNDYLHLGNKSELLRDAITCFCLVLAFLRSDPAITLFADNVGGCLKEWLLLNQSSPTARRLVSTLEF